MIPDVMGPPPGLMPGAPGAPEAPMGGGPSVNSCDESGCKFNTAGKCTAPGGIEVNGEHVCGTFEAGGAGEGGEAPTVGRPMRLRRGGGGPPPPPPALGARRLPGM